MEKFYDGFDFDMSAAAVRYGKYDGKIDYKQIASLEESERIKVVDALVQDFVQKKEETGFFASDDCIYINRLLGNSFKIDDNEIYHLFFRNLGKAFKESGDVKTSGTIVMTTIRDTVYEYLGKFDGDSKKRFSLTQAYFDDDDNFVVPSIKELKNKNASACVEYSSLAHNLWLLTGVKSYYVLSKDAKFEGSEDGHAFVVVEYGGKCRLFDLAQGVGGPIKDNPIELFENKKPLIINGMIYANAKYAGAPEKK